MLRFCLIFNPAAAELLAWRIQGSEKRDDIASSLEADCRVGLDESSPDWLRGGCQVTIDQADMNGLCELQAYVELNEPAVQFVSEEARRNSLGVASQVSQMVSECLEDEWGTWGHSGCEITQVKVLTPPII